MSRAIERDRLMAQAAELACAWGRLAEADNLVEARAALTRVTFLTQGSDEVIEGLATFVQQLQADDLLVSTAMAMGPPPIGADNSVVRSTASYSVLREEDVAGADVVMALALPKSAMGASVAMALALPKSASAPMSFAKAAPMAKVSSVVLGSEEAHARSRSRSRCHDGGRGR